MQQQLIVNVVDGEQFLPKLLQEYRNCGGVEFAIVRSNFQTWLADTANQGMQGAHCPFCPNWEELRQYLHDVLVMFPDGSTFHTASEQWQQLLQSLPREQLVPTLKREELCLNTHRFTTPTMHGTMQTPQEPPLMPANTSSSNPWMRGAKSLLTGATTAAMAFLASWGSHAEDNVTTGVTFAAAAAGTGVGAYVFQETTTPDDDTYEVGTV